jgi:hypothetical protein
MSIADTGRFWKILVIPVLQILEDSRKYWLYQYCRYWKILENTGNASIADTATCLVLLLPFLSLVNLFSHPFSHFSHLASRLFQILVNTSIPVFSRIFQYLQY